MRCDLNNGTNPIQYFWEQEDQSGLVTILAENNSSLISFTRVSRNHTGWYRCLVRNEVNQQLSERIWLDVLFGPDSPQIDTTAHSVTDQGYSVMENGNISLTCRALSNPASRYIWFYNNSEIYVGTRLTITKILRRDTGNYTCLAQNTNLNTYLNTSSKRTVTLTVYYPPNVAPTCSILPINNYTDLALTCSWDGGCPPATIYWRPNKNRDPAVSNITKVTQIQPGPETANNSLFICYGSHVALNATQSCNASSWLPYGEPRCSANSSHNNEHLMLSCSWEGGSPQVLLWWTSSSGEIQSTPEEKSDILVLHSSSIHNGKFFVCHAKHPLTRDTTQCVVTFEAPVLMTQHSMVSVYEGNDVQLACVVSKSYPATTEITWYNNFKQVINGTTRKYVLEQGAAWCNLTIVKTDRTMDSGQYWCFANNAVGGAEISVSLQVMSK
ncbi:V-set and immunoglobulin domain-containing protein 10-like 2 [Trichomycterus rosablanca]|uniref:V-set and immunoglobulin domain-containing protein 10-like 2 n=1 Tax=Trichomycterus rosablanca TaxID=2290929 RepID=UPI002F35B4B6